MREFSDLAASCTKANSHPPCSRPRNPAKRANGPSRSADVAFFMCTNAQVSDGTKPIRKGKQSATGSVHEFLSSGAQQESSKQCKGWACCSKARPPTTANKLDNKHVLNAALQLEATLAAGLYILFTTAVPESPVWPEHFHIVLLINRSNNLALADLWWAALSDLQAIEPHPPAALSAATQPCVRSIRGASRETSINRSCLAREGTTGRAGGTCCRQGCICFL